MTKTTKTTKTCRHGLTLATCVACVATARKTKGKTEDSDTLATLPVDMVVHGKTATLVPVNVKGGTGVRMAPAGAKTSADAGAVAIPDPAEAFGTCVLPSSVALVFGGTTATGRARKGATKVDVPMRPSVNADGLSTGVVAGTSPTTEGVPVKVDGEAFTVYASVRLTKRGAWYIDARVRPGHVKTTPKRTVSNANPFA